jgi:cysteine synthase A
VSPYDNVYFWCCDVRAFGGRLLAVQASDKDQIPSFNNLLETSTNFQICTLWSNYDDTMSMSDHPKAYGTAALTAAFVAGILLTLGFKRRRGQPSSSLDSRPASTYLPPLQLEDHTRNRQSIAGASTLPIAEGIEGIIGNTPLFKIKSLSEATGCTILAKAEFLNGAGGSPKDRVALNMIKTAEEEGLLTPWQGDTIYEGTVGSTGISLATLARAKGYKAYICMPNDQSTEKSDLLHHLGATVERVTPAPITSTEHFVNLARIRAKQHTDSSKDFTRGFFADQFESMANYKAHMQTTGPEIYHQTGGQVSFHERFLGLD